MWVWVCRCVGVGVMVVVVCWGGWGDGGKGNIYAAYRTINFLFFMVS